MIYFDYEKICFYNTEININISSKTITELSADEIQEFCTITPSGKTLASLNKRPTWVDTEATDDQLSQQAKATREAAISANITELDAEWQMLDDARDVRKVLQDAEITNALDTDSVIFRLSDNSWRDTTLAELKQVLAAHVARKREVWVQFNAWDSGDKSQPFEVK